MGYCKCQMLATSSVHGAYGNDNTSPNQSIHIISCFLLQTLNNWYSQDTRATSKKFHGKIAQLRPHCKAPCSAWWLKVGGSQGSRGRSIEDFGPQTPSFLYVTGATPRKSLPFFFVVAFVVRDLSKFP